MKNEAKLREEFENFQGKGFISKKRITKNSNLLMTLLVLGLKKCETSEGWVDKWKLSHSIEEKHISGESLGVSETTVKSWMERIKEFCKGYYQRDIWNVDENGCFFKAFPAKGLAKKVVKTKGGKKSKQRITVAYFINADGRNFGKPIKIWRSKKQMFSIS